ncbi:MAG: cob(I)yrinic acid a,c-diamide adenosyltransferase [Acetobacterales bacterium]
MIRLDRIYTGGGDEGETSLGDGTRVPKTHPRIAALAAVEEANAALGVARLHADGAVAEDLARIQNDLFDLGADLCVPLQEEGGERRERLRASPAQVERLEAAIDLLSAELAPLTSFILPGGSPASAQLHLARCVVRRAELAVLTTAEKEGLSPSLPVYLNRLSDYLFVAARQQNDGGKADVLWKPGG